MYILYMLSKYISFKIFLASFVLGLIFVYLWGPETKKIFIYPSPSNYQKIQYKDKTSQCFEFKPVETKCPINPFSVKTIPVQN